MKIKKFTFNAFQENTYVLYDETKSCVIIDPGCNNTLEEESLSLFISDNNLKPTMLINTHCHIDHILGNAFVHKKYGLELSSHAGEKVVLQAGKITAQMYGIQYEQSPEITIFYTDGDILSFGDSQLKVLYTPGHSPASISFYSEDAKMLIGGDVLFFGSIGRTDLPGGDHETLLESIRSKFFILPSDTVVYSGHGPETTIGREKSSNPFF